jgi:molybdate-binding protein
MQPDDFSAGHFVPLQSERYDLEMHRRTADLAAVKSFLDVLQRATLRPKLEVLASYGTSKPGRAL